MDLSGNKTTMESIWQEFLHLFLLLYFFFFMLKAIMRGFPGGPVVKNPPADAGDTGLISALEDSTCCGAAKPVLKAPQEEKPLQQEAQAPQQSSPHWPQLGKSPSSHEDPAQPNMKKK